MIVKIKGVDVQIDKQDLHLVGQYPWRYDGRYICRNEAGKKIYLHREICKPGNGLVTDHINNDQLDNRRANLRAVSPAVNSRNRVPGKGNKTGYVGVFWYERYKRYQAQARFRGKLVFLGRFETIEGAVAARREFDQQLAFCGLN